MCVLDGKLAPGICHVYPSANSASLSSCILFSAHTRSGSGVGLDGGSLAVEGIVGGALESGFGGELAATELARHRGSQLCGCASGEHCGFCLFYGFDGWVGGIHLLSSLLTMRSQVGVPRPRITCSRVVSDVAEAECSAEVGHSSPIWQLLIRGV